MLIIKYIFTIIWSFLVLFFLTFFFFTIREREKTAMVRSFLVFIFLLGVLIFQWFLMGTIVNILRWITIVLFVLFTVVSLIPYRNNLSIRIFESDERFDERDVMFARGEYEPSTRKYRIYYEKLHPEFKEFDDKLKKLPDVCKGGVFYQPLNSKICDAEFSYITNLLNAVDGEVSRDRIDVEPQEMTRRIKGLARYLGADLVGIAPVDKRFFYSNVGRGPERWGKRIKVRHKYAISFAIKMDHFMVSYAPRTPEVVESAKEYVKMATISVILANYIRSIGYSARAHISESNYQAILPPFAYLAGLGELGRNGFIITREFGPRVRLGLVTTDLPLLIDKPISFGVQDMCSFCKKCVYNCPSRSIPDGGKIVVRGVEKWQIDYEKCYLYWRRVGTDCGLCMYVCPYARQSNFFQKIMRRYSMLSHFSRRVFLLWDDFFYGKTPRRIGLPDWMT